MTTTQNITPADLSRFAARAIKECSGYPGARVRSIISGVMDELKAAGYVGPTGRLTKAGATAQEELLAKVWADTAPAKGAEDDDASHYDAVATAARESSIFA
jgi:hypothetical protein